VTMVLGVVGSPRRNGNTHLLVSTILEGAREAGATVDALFLKDLTIQECDGCHVCWTHRSCAKDDDMQQAYAKIIGSDAIVLGTPVYWYGPTALMKGFIDRFVYFNCPENREKIRGKSVVIAVPFEEDRPEVAAPVVAFFEKCVAYLQMNLVGKVIVPGVTEKGEVLRKCTPLKEARELGRKLAELAPPDKAKAPA